jgi:exopolysaccharide/PEP-CTERM locus tyrosine autokinase
MPGRPRDPVVPVALPAPERRTPSETLQVDLEALRTAGIVPPAAFADRLTEQFRRIKWPLLEAALGRGQAGAPAANAVMITSSLAGEGKTFCSFNLALSIAREKDLDVLLIDADVAKRHLTRLLGTDARPGLSDAAADAHVDPEQLVLGTGIPGLTFLPSGQRTPIASELFASRRMADVVAGLRCADPRRVVLFDCSPLLATNETQVLASLVDQIVLVVCAESTPQPVVLEAVSLLDRSKQIRCLLNQMRVSHLNEYYYYGYGYPANEQPRLP